MCYTSRVIFCLGMAFLSCSVNIHAQLSEKAINYSFTDTDLKESLQLLINEYKVPVLYISNDIKDIRVTAECEQCKVSEALNNILENSGLNWKQIKNQIILFNPLTDNVLIDPKNKNVHDQVLKAYVTDSVNNTPLPFATILIEGSNHGIIADDKGYFELKNLPADKYVLKILYMGYDPDTLIADLTLPGQSTVKIIKLDPTSYDLDAVVVKSTEIPTLEIEYSASVTKLNPKKMKLVPTLNQGDVLQNIKMLPGVSSINDNMNGFNIRGGSSDQTLVIFDGIPIYHSQHLFGFSSAFNANAVEEITLYTGGFSAKYGDRLSGILDIKGKSGKNEKLHAGVDADFFNLRGYVDIPISKKINFLANYSQSFDPMNQKEAITNREDYSLFNHSDQVSYYDDPKMGNNLIVYGASGSFNQQRLTDYYDATAKLTYTGEKETASLSMVYGLDELNANSALDSLASKIGSRYEKTDNVGVAFNYNRAWKEGFTSHFCAAYSKYDNRTNFVYNKLSVAKEDSIVTKYNNNNDIKNLRLNLENELELNSYYSFILGLEYSKIETGYSKTFHPDDSTSINAFSNYNASNKYIGYLENKISPFKKLDLLLGVRIINENRGGNYFMHRTGFNYRPLPGITLTYSWGMFYQYEHRTPSSLFYNVSSIGSSKAWIGSQDDLLPSQSQHHIAGLQFDSKKFSINASVYFKKYNNLSFFLPTKTTFIEIEMEGDNRLEQSAYLSWLEDRKYIGSDGDRIDLFLGEGTSRGIEAFISKNKGFYTSIISYHWGQTFYLFPYINGGKKFMAFNCREHELNFTNQLNYKNWYMGIAYTVASGKNYPSEYYSSSFTGKDISYSKHPASWKIENSQTLPTYHRIDMNFRKSWTNLWIFNGAVGFSVYNAFNFSNIISKYNINESNENNEPVANTEMRDQYDTGRIYNVFLSINF